MLIKCLDRIDNIRVRCYKNQSGVCVIVSKVEVINNFESLSTLSIGSKYLEKV